MSLPDTEDPCDYPIEFMGEHPPIEILLSYNKKDSKLKEVNSEKQALSAKSVNIATCSEAGVQSMKKSSPFFHVLLCLISRNQWGQSEVPE